MSMPEYKPDFQYQTRLVKVSAGDPIVKEAAQLIQEGHLVAFPTETVYGLGANGLSDQACQKIFQAKERPADNPLILHIADMEQLEELLEELPSPVLDLLEDLWPGPLTIIGRKSKKVPETVTAGGSTVAIRMPQHELALDLIRQAGLPIAAPSANRSGRPSPTLAQHVYEDLQGRLPLILDGGPTAIGIESTVVDVSGPQAQILRPGFYTQEDLAPYLAHISYDPGLKAGQRPKSPGQKYQHYAPKAKLYLLQGDHEAVAEKMQALIQDWQSQGQKVGLLLSEDWRAEIEADQFYSLGAANDLLAMSHHFFAGLRALDHFDVDYILSTTVAEKGLGLSLMNRMLKAANGRVITC